MTGDGLGIRGAFVRAWSLSHTIPSHHHPTAGRRRGLPTSLQSAAGPPRGPPAGRPARHRPSWRNFAELRFRPAEESAPSPSRPAPSQCPRLLVLAQPGAPVIGRAPGVHCVYANQSPAPQVCPTPAGAPQRLARRWAPEPRTVIAEKIQSKDQAIRSWEIFPSTSKMLNDARSVHLPPRHTGDNSCTWEKCTNGGPVLQW